MGQQTHGATLTGVAGAALGQYLRVKIDSSGELVVAVAGGTDEVLEVGTVETEAFAQGDEVRYRARNAEGTTKMVASASIAIGAAVYGTTGGKIDDVAAGSALGIALEAATATNDVIEVLRT